MPRYITGFHAIEENLKASQSSGGGAKRSPELLWVAGAPGPRVKKLIELAEKQGLKVQKSDDRELARLSGISDHRGAVLQAREDIQAADSLSFEEILDQLRERLPVFESLEPKLRQTVQWPCILVLDSITDPHNLGAILRSADKFGVDLVVIPQRRSAQENETVRKSSAGASAWVRTVVVGNLNRAVEQCREAGFWICGADMEGTPVHQLDSGRPLVIVMGSEGKGIGRLLGQHCDEMVSIPCTGHVDSLNVSVATAVILYEIRRQQGFPW